MKPTIGSDVWYHACEGDGFSCMDQPLAAKVAYVHSDKAVNLAVFDCNGNPYSKIGVPLIGDGYKSSDEGYWEWPHRDEWPAEKKEELERAASTLAQAEKTEELAKDVRFMMEEKHAKPAKSEKKK